MYCGNSTNLKYKKRSGLYENSTGSLKYNPLTKESWSYTWWPITKKIGKYIVFNNYNYSNTTSKHNWIIYHEISELKNVITVSFLWDKYKNNYNEKLIYCLIERKNNKNTIKYFCKQLKLNYKLMVKNYKNKQIELEKCKQEIKEKRKQELKELKSLNKYWKDNDIYITNERLLNE